MKILFVLLFTLGTYFYIPSKIDVFVLIIHHRIIFLSFGITLIVFPIISKIFYQKIIFLMVLIHEFYHAIVAFLLGGTVHSFYVGNREGLVKISSNPFWNTPITLAPYVFPILPFFYLFLIWVSSNGTNLNNMMSFFGGISFAIYFIRVYKQARPYQTDLKKNGVLFSYIAIIISNIFFLFFFLHLLNEK